MPENLCQMYGTERLNRAGPILFVETKTDVDQATEAGLVAVCADGGVVPNGLQRLADREVTIITSDAPDSRANALQVAFALRKAAKVRLAYAPEGLARHLADGGTVDDLRLMPDDELADWVRNVEAVHKAAKKPTETVTRVRPPKTFRELRATNFKPLTELIEGLVVPGFTLLVGPPKIGKSWLAAGMVLSVATGTPAFGCLPTTKAAVLYLSLEDSDRSLNDRLDMAAGGNEVPDDGSIHTMTELPPGEVGLTYLQTWLTEHPEVRMVVIDLLTNIRPPGSKNSTQYENDYHWARSLKDLGDRMDVAIVGVHHSRKAGAEDFVDKVSATNGLSGGSTGVIVITRDRMSTEALVSVTSREFREHEWTARLDDGVWTFTGDAADARQTDTTKNIVAAVRRLDTDGTGAAGKDVAAELGMSSSNVRTYLSRLVKAGVLDRQGVGRFSVRGTSTPVAPVAPQVKAHTGRDNGTEAVTPTATSATSAYEADMRPDQDRDSRDTISPPPKKDREREGSSLSPSDDDPARNALFADAIAAAGPMKPIAVLRAEAKAAEAAAKSAPKRRRY